RRALLLHPREATARTQFLREALFEREEMTYVCRRVVDLTRRQRTHGPVVTLARGRQRDAQPCLEQRVEAQRGRADEPRGDRRVEDRAKREAVTPLEVREIVVAGVNHHH